MPPISDSTFEWRARLGPWRWLILGTLGVVPTACGGRSDRTDAGRGVADLEGIAGGATASPEVPAVSAPRPNPGSSGTGSGGSASTEGPTTSGPVAAAGTAGVAPTSLASECVLESRLGGNWEKCTNGMIHRPEQGSCASTLPRAARLIGPFPGVEEGADAGWQYPCREDQDCTEAPHGHCENGQISAYCAYGCVLDSDCGDAEVCLCGADIGECVPAECRVDTDCGGSSLCGSYARQPTCGGIRFGCQTPEDECAGDRDCGEYGYCMREFQASLDEAEPGAEAPNRSCAVSICSVGRPFLIDGAERLASSAVRQDWYPSEPSAPPLPAEVAAASSAAIARGWTEQALMEHASVAAFARFALQLLQLGAPAELIEQASAAMQDEIRHARACFELARRHSTQDVGPGSLPIEGALDQMTPTSIVLDALREGCIGETVAALEATEALQHCEDPVARAVLERIAVEEGQHAELAWRFVAWAIETRPELLERVREVFAEELAGARLDGERGPRHVAAADRELARHGLLSPQLRAALRQRVLAGVVAPCAQALLAGAGWQRPDAASAVRRASPMHRA